MGILIGQYEVEKMLGKGAMGEVFKARAPKNGQYVAIKILKPELCDNPRAKKRFKREINQTISLKHPNLIAAYDAGEYRGRLYYVMEYIEGTSVKKQLLTRGSYDESRALEIIIQVSEALEYTSTGKDGKEEIIHRDIKPDNIMITYDGKAKLCDLG